MRTTPPQTPKKTTTGGETLGGAGGVKKKKKKSKKDKGGDKDAAAPLAAGEDAAAAGATGKPSSAPGITTKGTTYEQEFDLEMQRMKQGKARSTAWGSTYRAPPPVLHGYSAPVKGATASERLDMRASGKADKFCK